MRHGIGDWGFWTGIGRLDGKLCNTCSSLPKLNGAQDLAGMNFLIENKVCQEPFKRRIIVDN